MESVLAIRGHMQSEKRGCKQHQHSNIAPQPLCNAIAHTQLRDPLGLSNF
jgi:hypothetical protein